MVNKEKEETIVANFENTLSLINICNILYLKPRTERKERKGKKRKGKERKGKERKDPLFIEGNTFTSIGCTLLCGPHH